MLISFKKMLSRQTTRRALLLGCGLQMIQQLSAINTVMYYSASIIQMAGVEDEHKIIWLTAAVGFGYCVFALISIQIVERVGRRKLTLWSVAGVVMALLILSLTFFLLDHNTPEVTVKLPYKFTRSCSNHRSCSSCVQNSNCGFCYLTMSRSQVMNGTCLATGANDIRPPFCNVGPYTFDHQVPVSWTTKICPSQYAWLAVCAMIFYLAMFAIGLGPMPWTINAEIYPLWARNAGTSASTATNKFMNLVVSLTFLSLIDYLTRPGVFVLYGGLTLLGFVFLYILLPETKGTKLEDVELLFRK